MPKYAKDDCRNNAKRLEKPKGFSRMRWIEVFKGENRKERLGIGARFRHLYGKAAYAEMKMNAARNGIIEVINDYLIAHNLVAPGNV